MTPFQRHRKYPGQSPAQPAELLPDDDLTNPDCVRRRLSNARHAHEFWERGLRAAQDQGCRLESYYQDGLREMLVVIPPAGSDAVAYTEEIKCTK